MDLTSVWKGVLTKDIVVPPVILVSNKVIRAIVADTEKWMEPETGESLVGLVIPSTKEFPPTEPTFVVLGTIPAGMAEREGARFELGGEFQYQVFQWHEANWNAMREASRGKTPDYKWKQEISAGMVPKAFDLPLADLGDWHKHPGGMSKPSFGDLGTAIQTLSDPSVAQEYLLCPIATVRSKQREKVSWDGWAVSREDPDYKIGITFSYISRTMLASGMREFMAIKPHIIDEKLLPQLPPLSWHLENPLRYRQEIKLLTEYGCEVQVVYREVDGKLPFEICFAIRREEGKPWDKSILVVTAVDYPKRPPVVKLIPQTQAETSKKVEGIAQVRMWFDRLWGRANVQIPLPPLARGEKGKGKITWSPENFLLSLVMAMERSGKVWEETTAGTE